MGSATWRVLGSRPLEGDTHDVADAGRGREGTRRSFDREEQALGACLRSTSLEVRQNGFAHVLGQREQRFTTPLPPYAERAASPIQVVEGHAYDVGAPKSQAREQEQDGVVAQPVTGRQVATRHDALDVGRFEIAGQRRKSPRRHRRNAELQTSANAPLGHQEAQERADRSNRVTRLTAPGRAEPLDDEVADGCNRVRPRVLPEHLEKRLENSLIASGGAWGDAPMLERPLHELRGYLRVPRRHWNCRRCCNHPARTKTGQQQANTGDRVAEDTLVCRGTTAAAMATLTSPANSGWPTASSPRSTQTSAGSGLASYYRPRATGTGVTGSGQGRWTCAWAVAATYTRRYAP